MATDDAERAERLNRFLDGLTGGSVSSPNGRPAPEPELAATVRRLRALDDAPIADGRFADRLLQELMPATTDATFIPFPQLPATTAARHERPSSWSRPRRDTPRPRWPLAQVATAALLVLTAAAAIVALIPNRPGRQEEPPAFLAAPSGISATPASNSGPIVELLWQTHGEPNFLLHWPNAAAVDPQGNLWITDAGNGRFVIFSPDGRALEAWGTPGSAEGEFEFRCGGDHYGGVAFDAAGNIYVADSGNERIQKFGRDRAFLTSWRSDGIVDNQLLVTGRGNRDVANRQILCPVAIAVDGQGRVYVSDQGAGKIEVFDPDGRPLATATAKLMQPEGVALDPNGNIWVADLTSRVLKFSPDGDLLETWGTYGHEDGELSTPMGIAVDAQGRIFVSDQSGRVQIFAPDGTFLGDLGSGGFDAGQFADPVGVVLDGRGHVYVVEQFAIRVQKFRLLPPFGPG